MLTIDVSSDFFSSSRDFFMPSIFVVRSAKLPTRSPIFSLTFFVSSPSISSRILGPSTPIAVDASDTTPARPTPSPNDLAIPGMLFWMPLNPYCKSSRPMATWWMDSEYCSKPFFDPFVASPMPGIVTLPSLLIEYPTSSAACSMCLASRVNSPMSKNDNEVSTLVIPAARSFIAFVACLTSSTPSVSSTNRIFSSLFMGGIPAS